MRTVSIRKLRNRTGVVVQDASRHGEIRVTDNGRGAAKIEPQTEIPEAPYFVRRKMSASFRRLDKSGKTGLGTNSTIIISEDREDRA
jgi:prevent-host-death family protein